MDPEHKALMEKIIKLLEEIKSHTEDIYWTKSAVEDVERAVKNLEKSED